MVVFVNIKEFVFIFASLIAILSLKIALLQLGLRGSKKSSINDNIVPQVGK